MALLPAIGRNVEKLSTIFVDKWYIADWLEENVEKLSTIFVDKRENIDMTRIMLASDVENVDNFSTSLVDKSNFDMSVIIE